MSQVANTSALCVRVCVCVCVCECVCNDAKLVRFCANVFVRNKPFAFEVPFWAPCQRFSVASLHCFYNCMALLMSQAPCNLYSTTHPHTHRLTLNTCVCVCVCVYVLQISLLNNFAATWSWSWHEFGLRLVSCLVGWLVPRFVACFVSPYIKKIKTEQSQNSYQTAAKNGTES